MNYSKLLDKTIFTWCRISHYMIALCRVITNWFEFCVVLKLLFSQLSCMKCYVIFLKFLKWSLLWWKYFIFDWFYLSKCGNTGARLSLLDSLQSIALPEKPVLQQATKRVQIGCKVITSGYSKHIISRVIDFQTLSPNSSTNA